MITYGMIQDAQTSVVECWGDAGKRVVEEAAKVSPFNGNVSKWLDNCTAMGGNWGGMFLSGVRKLYPTVWDVIPNDMGIRAFEAILSTLILCGVDTSE